MQSKLSSVALVLSLIGSLISACATEASSDAPVGTEAAKTHPPEIGSTKGNQSIGTAFDNWQYSLVSSKYKELPLSQKKDPALCYKVGYSLMRIHEFAAAEAPLRSAIAGGVSGFPSYPAASELLSRIEELKRLRPPCFQERISKSPLPFTIRARSTEWLKSVESEFPNYATRAREIFGDQLPPVSIYIFDDRNEYFRFFKAMFECDPAEGQDATGMSNVVVACETTKEGRDLGFQRINWRRGVILHEYCHALCSTIYGDGFSKKVPQWFDEGVADTVADPYYHALFRWYRNKLATAGKTTLPPTYESLKKNMQEDREIRYALAHEMILELVQKRDCSLLKDILLQARKYDGDFETAIEIVTGIPARRAYERVVARYWGRHPSETTASPN
ncbi:MAG: hypothetical protein K2Z81_18965 [Cyanobacteria bacterium]|nr:hypothetical protein [Cyanobacteriota bacterium]